MESWMNLLLHILLIFSNIFPFVGCATEPTLRSHENTTVNHTGPTLDLSSLQKTTNGRDGYENDMMDSYDMMETAAYFQGMHWGPGTTLDTRSEPLRYSHFLPLDSEEVDYDQSNLGKHSAEMIGGSFWNEEDTKNCKTKHMSCMDNSNSKMRRRRCLCNEECLEYGNCCHDFTFGKLDINSIRAKRWSCSSVSEGVAYYLITSCPTSWSNSHVKEQCEMNISNKTDSFQKIPVSSRDSLLTYRNVYCAICNGDVNSTFWSTELHCPKIAKVHVDNLHRTSIDGCTTGFKPPTFTYGDNNGTLHKVALHLIRCDSSLVSECADTSAWAKNYEPQDIIFMYTKCAMIYAPVSRTEYPITYKYKNKYCAKCNGIDNVHSMCPMTPYLSKPSVAEPALSLLLDMDFTQGGSIVGSQERCPEMHLYDPWRRQCRNVMCGWHYKYVDGVCVFDPDAPKEESERYGLVKWTFNGTLESGCLRTQFVADEITYMKNGTLSILGSEFIFNPGEYEQGENSSITVCVPSAINNNYVSTFTNVQGFLTLVGLGLSLVSLLIKIGFTLFSKERRKLPSKIVLFLSLSLFFAQLLFLFGVNRTEYPVLCTMIGIILHYCFLSSFFWMNVLAYDIWKTFASSDSVAKAHFEIKKLVWYCLYGWLVPMAIVTTAVLANWVLPYSFLNPQYGKSVCWISNKIALAVFFGGPLALLLILNATFFVITALQIRRTTQASMLAVKHSRCGRDNVEFGLYCKLACIMGLTWVFGFVDVFAKNIVLSYIFIMLNSIQGVYVLVAFTHFKVPKWLRAKKLLYMSSNHSTTFKSSLTLTSSLSKA